MEMDEVENHALSLLLLLDEHLLPLFLEWSVTCGLSNMVLFLLDADFLRYKSGDNICTIQDERKFSVIMHYISKTYELETNQSNVNVFNVMTKDHIDCIERVQNSGLPLLSVCSKLTDAVWGDLLSQGRNIVASPQWISLRRNLITFYHHSNCKTNESNEETLDTLGLEHVLGDPALCKYFERFLHHDPSELASLHCLLMVRKLLARVENIDYPTSRSISIEGKGFKDVSKYEDKSHMIEVGEAFKILLSGARALQRQFFPAGSAFLSTFSLTTMMGGLRRVSGNTTTIANCAGLSEALRMEIVATLGLNSAVRTDEVDNVDKAYAISCSTIIKQLLVALEGEMVSFLSIRYGSFKQKSDDFAMMVAVLQCRSNPSVLRYKKKVDFLHDVVRREHVVHWADSRAKGVLFASCHTSVRDGDERGSLYSSKVITHADECLSVDECNIGKSLHSLPLMAFKIDFLVPVNISLNEDNIVNCPHQFHVWGTRDILNPKVGECVAQNCYNHDGRVGSIQNTCSTDLIMEDSDESSNGNESYSSSEYGDLSVIHFMSRSLDDAVLFGNTSARPEKLSSSAFEDSMMSLSLMELDPAKLNEIKRSQKGTETTIPLVGMVFHALQDLGLIRDDFCFDGHQNVSFCLNHAQFRMLFTDLFGESALSDSGAGDNWCNFHVCIKSIGMDGATDPSKVESVLGKGALLEQATVNTKSKFALGNSNSGKVSFMSHSRIEDPSPHFKSAVSIVVSVTEANIFRSTLYVGKMVVDHICHKVVKTDSMKSQLASTVENIKIDDPFTRFWWNTLQHFITIEKDSIMLNGKQMWDFFHYPNRNNLLHEKMPLARSIYDCYLGSYPMRYDIHWWLVDLFPELSTAALCKNYHSCISRAWPITRAYGPADFSFKSVVETIPTGMLVQMVVLLLATHSVMVISHDKNLLKKLSIMLPRILYPFHVIGNTHTVKWINSPNELSDLFIVQQEQVTQIQPNAHSYGPSPLNGPGPSFPVHSRMEYFILVDSNCYGVVREEVATGRIRCDDVTTLVFDVDAQTITIPFQSPWYDMQYEVHDLRQRRLYDNSSPVLARLYNQIEAATKAFEADHQLLLSTLPTQRMVALLPILIILYNCAIEIAFNSLWVDLILAPLPGCIQYFSETHIISCNMQQVLSDLLCRHQTNSESSAFANGARGMYNSMMESDRKTLHKEDLLKLNFDQFLAEFNHETIRSTLISPGKRNHSFAHSFYANYLAGLSPTFVEFLKRHGDLIDEWKF